VLGAFWERSEKVSITKNKVIVRHPILNRIPVTPTSIAARMAANTSVQKWERQLFEKIAVRCAQKIATDEERIAFHDGIIKLIRGMAKKFENQNQDMDDLVQACLTRLWETLHHFNPNIATLSTWTHFVVKSVLCRMYGETKKGNRMRRVGYGNDQDDEDGDMNALENCEQGAVKENQLMRLHMRNVMRNLFDSNPNEVDILQQLFGDPYKDDYEPHAHPPSKAEIARNINRDYSEVYNFFKTVVKPFFEKEFPEFN
jgi:DNA-directed RNA polymerase specialized sigma24 family protein